jgi:hypothetical protein
VVGGTTGYTSSHDVCYGHVTCVSSEMIRRNRSILCLQVVRLGGRLSGDGNWEASEVALTFGGIVEYLK